MSKKKYQKLKICNNYAKPCYFALNCNSCKNKVVRVVKYGNVKEYTLIGCKVHQDITKSFEEKRNCFVCSGEGTSKCKEN